MSTDGPPPSSNRRNSLLFLAGIGAFVYGTRQVGKWLPGLGSEPLRLKVHETRRLVPAFKFTSPDERQLTFSNFSGKHLLVNVWAKWCPPCKEEMPSLDRLQQRLGPDSDVVILPLSVDPVGFEQMQAFYDVIGVKSLRLYRGEESDVMQNLAVPGLPTTVLLDHQGFEIARMIGPTTWDSTKIVDQLLALTNSTRSSGEFGR